MNLIDIALIEVSSVINIDTIVTGMIAPTTANIVQNLISFHDQGIAVPQLTAGLVEATPCE